MFASSFRSRAVLARNAFTMRSTSSQMAFNNLLFKTQPYRVFSSGPQWHESAPQLGDLPDVAKVNYTEEFPQGLSEEEKS